MKDGDRFDRSAGAFADQLYPGGVMALAIGRGTGVYDERSIGLQMHRAVLGSGHTRGAIDEHCHANTQHLHVIVVASLCLFGSQRVQVKLTQQHIETAGIVAGVIDDPTSAGERQGRGRQ